MEKQRQAPRTQLFVLRVWQEDLGDGQTEWRGDIQHTTSREKQYFREWRALLDFVQTQLQNASEDDIPFHTKWKQ